MHYFATDADGPKTGDVGNHALRIVEDGVVGTIAASPAEIDATNAPGMYKVAITAAENTADVVTLCGKSSTSGVTISPSTWTNITNADANAAAGAGYASGNTTALTTIDGIVDAILVDTAALSTPIDANITQVNGLDMSPTHTGTVKVGSTSGAIQLVNIGGETALSTVDDFYKDRFMVFATGNLAGQARRVKSYTGSTLTATTDGSCTAVPDTSSVVKFM